MQLIHGELSPRDAVFYAQRNTRHYAKRQITWFRRERELQWLKGFGDAPRDSRSRASERGELSLHLATENTTERFSISFVSSPVSKILPTE